MRILNENNIEIESPDLSLGYLKKDELFVKHHDHVDAVEEEGHYETVRTYPNGGKDVEWVVDIPGAEAREAWDEYEKIYRYVLYTEEELAKMEEEKNRPTIEARVSELEKTLDMILLGEADRADLEKAYNYLLTGVIA